MSPKIRINTRFASRRVTGVERWGASLLKIFGDRVSPVHPAQPLQGLRGHLWEQWVLPARLSNGEILFSPANTGPLLVRNQVLSLFDIGPLDHPEWYHPAFSAWYRLLIPALARRVGRIVTTSEYSARRIHMRLGVDPGKITVVKGGVDTEVFSPPGPEAVSRVRRRYSLPDRFLLFVGSIQPRKNIAMLIAARSLLPDPPPIILVGARGPQFPAIDLRGVHPIGRLPDPDLAVVYGAATMLVNPSMYEGGGLTILEAMACGCPVVAVDNAALPEYTGSAARLVAPQQPEALAAAIQEIFADPELQLVFREAGKVHAARFSWQACADQVWQVLENFER